MRTANIAMFVFALVALVQTLRLFARFRSPFRATVFWVLIWLSIGIFGLFPDLIDVLMHSTMMRNRMFFISVVAILVLYAAFFHHDTRNAEIARRVSRLAQEVSLLRLGLESDNRADGGKDTDETAST